MSDIFDNHDILETFRGKINALGRYAGEEKNKYWLVKNRETDEEYYIMDVSNDRYTLIDINSINRVLQIPQSWTVTNGYVICEISRNKKMALHAYLMNHIGNGTTKGALSVDHINRNKLDNRLSNLRLATQSEQNQNTGKRNRKHNAKPLPDGIQQSDLPKYVTYNAEYKKDDNGERVLFRDYFRIEKHPKLGDTIWTTSKSKAYTIRQKLQQAIDHLDVLNRMDTNETAIHDI
jgi:hypothetical protein